MAALNRILSLLAAQRQALVEQLAAIDEAIDAVSRAETVGLAPPEAAVDSVLPRRITSRRVLSDDHRHALTAGARRARHAREAGKGAAREALDDSFVPAIGKRDVPQQPRLVKRPR